MTVFKGRDLLNAISVQMFQNKMKMFLIEILVRLTENLQFFFKKRTLSAMVNELVTIIYIRRAVLDGAKRIEPRSIY